MRKYFQAKTPGEYFYQRVNKADPKDCWLWNGGLDKDGYGQVHTARVAQALGVTRAHQMAFKMFRGAIPADKVVCHKCDNPQCVNPKHLFLGTVSDNNLDCIRKGRNSPVSGVRNAMAKLTPESIYEIRELQGTVTCFQVAKRYGISFAQVCNIWRRDSWSHI